MFPALAGCNTPAGPKDEREVPLQFIDETSISQKGVSHNKRLVRSHVSKLNRQREKGHQQKLTWTELAQRPATFQRTTSFASSDRDDSVDAQGQSRLPSEHERDYGNEGSSPIRTLSLNGADDDSLSLRSVSPLMGGLKAQAFTCDPFVDESAHYYLKIILPNAFLPTQAWFKMFCDEPLVFHGFSAVCNLHLAMTDSYSARIKRQRMLIHKNEAIRLVNQKLSNLAYEDIEPVMLGMFTLYPEDEEIQKAYGKGKTAFVPHLPWADDMDIYLGGNPDTHRRAISWLVDKAGGIEKLNLPGLAKATATNDLILANMSGSKPYFPWLWPVDPFILLESVQFVTFGNPSEIPNSGFQKLDAHLPVPALYCFNSLACIDRLMAEVRRRRMDDSETQLLITSRDTTHHRLLCMDSWSTIDTEGSIDVSAAVYECCRLTCLIYSQCVIFPVPRWTVGLGNHLAQLRSVLELMVARSAIKGISAVIMWSSLVGGIAALRTSHRAFFMETLRNVKLASQVSSLRDLLAIARQFVWSDCAGEHAAAMTFELAGIEPYG